MAGLGAWYLSKDSELYIVKARKKVFQEIKMKKSQCGSCLKK
jgi:hypothetical protein